MAGRSKLSDEEREARRIEKEQLMAGRSKRVKATNDNITNNSTMENEKKEGEQNQNPAADANQTGGGGDNNNNNGGGNNNTAAGSEENNSGGGENNNSGGGENNNTGAGDGLSDGAKFQPNKNWKPFKGQRIERSYSTPKIDETLLNTEIPEANINVQQNTTNAEDILNKPLADSQPAAGPKKPEPVNSEWNSMSETEKQLSAEQTAEMMLGVYDKLHYFGRIYIKVDEEEIIEMHNDGKIDMNAATVENDDDPEKEVTIKEFWGDFNIQVEDRFVVTDKFKTAVKPAMVRLCMKYGLGASDGLFLAYKFGEDAATKVAMLVGFKKTVGKMNEHFMKRHTKFKEEVEAEVQRRIEKENAKNANTKKKEQENNAETVDKNKKPPENKTEESTQKKD